MSKKPREYEIWTACNKHTILGYKTIKNQWDETILAGEFGEVWPQGDSRYTLAVFNSKTANAINKKLKITYLYKMVNGKLKKVKNKYSIGEEALYSRLILDQLKEIIHFIKPIRYQSMQIKQANKTREGK